MNDSSDPGTFRQPQLAVEAARGVVRVGGVPVSLTARERQVAVILALEQGPVGSRRLGLMLNPDSDDTNAGNVAKVYVHRLRRRVGSGFVLSFDGGYALAPAVVRDVAEASRALARWSGARCAMDACERDRLVSLAASLRAQPPPALADSEWFASAAPSLRRLGHDLAMLVGRRALDDGCSADAVRVARQLTYEDPCDEEAWELLLTAHVRCGETAAAERELRFYEKALARELQAAPSPAVRAIVERPAVARSARTIDARPSQNGRSAQRATAV
jgi:DNA-binding SARP family transcriptional activator